MTEIPEGPPIQSRFSRFHLSSIIGPRAFEAIELATGT
jgi:hypothetical protein